VVARPYDVHRAIRIGIYHTAAAVEINPSPSSAAGPLLLQAPEAAAATAAAQQ